MSDGDPRPDGAEQPPAGDAHAPDDASPEPPPAEERTRSRIIIKKSGEVIIENLSIDLVELAMALDPDSEVACDLSELLAAAAAKNPAAKP